jgi:myo-inositol-1(or 4)-monophosphatase
MLDAAIAAARAAGQIILKNQNVLAKVTYKDKHNIATNTDTQAEKAVLKILRDRFPDHAFFSEERGKNETSSEYLWIIDPLDGTTNFVHHVGHSSVSIALIHQEKVELAVILNPFTEELFTAQRGSGALLNNQPIKPSTTANLATSVISLGRGASERGKMRHITIAQTVIPRTRSMRILGSTALDICYTACGRFDAHINNDCMFYDCAAGNLIAEEAGATVSDFRGTPWTKQSEGSKDVLVTNPTLHKKFIALLTEQHL